MKILFILLLIGTFEVIQTKRLDKPVRSPAKHVYSSKKIKEVKRTPDKNILFKIDDNDKYYLIKTYFNSALAKLNDIEEGKLNDEVPLLSKVKITTANAVLSAYIEYTLKRTLKISLNDVAILKKDGNNKSNTKNGVTIAELLHLILQEAKKANYEEVCKMYPEISLPKNIEMKSKFMRDYIKFVNHVIEGANFEGIYIDESYVHKFEPELSFINSTSVNSTVLSKILNSNLDPTKQQKWSIVSSQNPPQSANSSKVALSTTRKLPPPSNEKENNSKIEINQIPPINKFNPKEKFTDAFKFVPKVPMQTLNDTDSEPIKWKDFISKIRNEAKVEVTQLKPLNINILKNKFLDSNKIGSKLTIPNIFEAITPAAIKWKDFISEIETETKPSFENTLMAPPGVNSSETGEITTPYVKDRTTPTIKSVTVLLNNQEVRLPDKHEVIPPNDLNPEPIKWKDFKTDIENEKESNTVNSLKPPSNTNISKTNDISTPIVLETTTPNKNVEEVTPKYQTVTFENTFTESTKFGPEGTIPSTYEVKTPNALEPSTIKWKDFISKIETKTESSLENYQTVTSKDSIEEGTTQQIFEINTPTTVELPTLTKQYDSPSTNPLTVETTTQRINILKNTDSAFASTTSDKEEDLTMPQNTDLSTEDTVNMYSTNMGTYLSTTEYFDIADLEGTDKPVVIKTASGMSTDSKTVECITEPVTESPEDVTETIPYDFVNYKSHSNHLDSPPSYRFDKLGDQDTDKNNVHNESGVYKYKAVSQRQVINTKITRDSIDNYVNLNNTNKKTNDNIEIEKYASALYPTEANDGKYDTNNLLHEIELAVSDIIKRFCEIENDRNVSELICSLVKQQTLAYVKSLNSVLNNFDKLKEKTYVGQYFKPNYDLSFERMQKQNYLRMFSYYISRCPHFVQLGPKYQKKTNEYSVDGPKLKSLLYNYPKVALDSKLTVSLIEHPKLIAGLWSHAGLAKSLFNIWGDHQ